VYSLAAATFGYLLALAGGIFFGFASCGGYIWHKQTFAAALAIAIALVLASHRPRSIWVRLSLAAGIVPAFLLTRALAAPFYLDLAGPSEYFHRVLLVLQFGPC
jgi:hypothetical protein